MLEVGSGSHTTVSLEEGGGSLLWTSMAARQKHRCNLLQAVYAEVTLRQG